MSASGDLDGSDATAGDLTSDISDLLLADSAEVIPMSTEITTEEQVLKLKAEIRRLQLLVRRMSTVDTMQLTDRKQPTVKKLSSDGFLFDSFEDGAAEDIAILTAQNNQLSQENENLRAEVESLKDLCETNRTGIDSLSADEINLLEKRLSLKLIKNISSTLKLVLDQEQSWLSEDSGSVVP